MSIFSAIHADSSNKLKRKWAAELRDAYEAKDWEKVRAFLEMLEDYYFSE